MKTTLATANNFDDAAEDAQRCAQCMSPEIQTYLEYAAIRFNNNLDGASWALTWGFADLLAQFHGDLTLLERTVASYIEMPEDARAAARECQERVKGILVATRGQGFSTTILGALSNITSQVLHAQIRSPKRAKREADKFTENLIMALNKARRTVLN